MRDPPNLGSFRKPLDVLSMPAATPILRNLTVRCQNMGPAFWVTYKASPEISRYSPAPWRPFLAEALLRAKLLVKRKSTIQAASPIPAQPFQAQPIQALPIQAPPDSGINDSGIAQARFKHQRPPIQAPKKVEHQNAPILAPSQTNSSISTAQ